MNNFTEIIDIICNNFILFGYIFITVLLLFLYWIFPNYRQYFKGILSLSNMFLLVSSTIYLLIIIISILNEIITGGEFERSYMDNRIFGPYWFAFWGFLISRFLLIQILWNKKLRKNILVSVLLIPFLLLENVFGFGVFIFNFYFIIYLIIIIPTYFLIYKKAFLNKYIA